MAGPQNNTPAAAPGVRLSVARQRVAPAARRPAGAIRARRGKPPPKLGILARRHARGLAPVLRVDRGMQYPATSRRVLVVDHDPDTRIALRESLEAHEFAVSVEERGEAVIQAVERAAFDAIIVDKELPDIGGLDLLGFLRHRCPTTPVVLTTRFGGALSAAVADRCGAARCIDKSVRPTELVAMLRELMEHRRPPRSRRAVAPSARIGTEPAWGGEGDLWAVVPAEGHGARRRSVTRRVHGEQRVGPDARPDGSRLLLRRALDLAALRVRAGRTVVPARRSHREVLDAEVGGGPGPRVILQPRDRGTAADVLLAAYWIRWRDPAATVIVLPSDQFVADRRRFMDHVAETVEFVGRYPRWIMLLGAEPAGAETGYGWIIPGPVLDCTARGPVWRVDRFLGAPSSETARRCRAAGAFWSTGVVVARAATLVDAARQLLPAMHSRFVLLAPLVGGSAEPQALRRVYATIPSADFSRALLETSTPIMAMTRLSGVEWCDLRHARHAAARGPVRAALFGPHAPGRARRSLATS